MDSMFDVTERVAAVTGGAGILCSEMCRELAHRGGRIAILDRDFEKAGRLAEEIKASGGCALAVPVDVLDKASLVEALDRVISVFGGVDILINGAGGNRKGAITGAELSFFDLPLTALHEVFDLNFFGTVLASQVFGKAMAGRGKGTIVNISSMSAFRPLTRVVAYSAAKAAVSNFTQWLAAHVANECSHDIRVNAIAPGFFITEQNRDLLVKSDSSECTPRGVAVLEHTPMARFGAPADLTGTLIWLVSDASRFVSGTVIPVDGGFNGFAGV